MSEHKTGVSNWTDEDKRVYLKRRNKGLRGTLSPVTTHQTIKDDQGNDQRVPVSIGGTGLSRSKSNLPKGANLRQERRAYNRQERKATSRGN